MLSSTPAFAATSIELTDKRAENQNGLQLIYEVGIRPVTTHEIDPRIRFPTVSGRIEIFRGAAWGTVVS